ncbi:hypothetical protein [Pseudomonas sp. DTU_2021_1001937_2_SI_NGA_ILE_001]|uniref:hypothetical protein n=1 Tax=Pseudomonas sp. DTU_2021_1001937_2_SI_NGA_ILE_001 TaxID=3077589 RepID=UPI0028FC2C6A|nr:hypothetical protein [Pseudomonas sp. DTU_2021_1001937_2_SI_NGA_ILE_001]
MQFESLIGCLGQRHGTFEIPGFDMDPSVSGCEGGKNWFAFEAAPGVMVEFGEGGVFESIAIRRPESGLAARALAQALPLPLSLDMDRAQVRRLFGAPCSAHPPYAFNGTGGTDIFEHVLDAYPCVHLAFEYQSDLSVSVIFMLLNTTTA